MAVGGIKEQILLIPDHPTVARIRKNIHACTVPSCSPCSHAFHAFVLFVIVFGFSPFYPCCNHLYFNCMVFHLVCKAT